MAAVVDRLRAGETLAEARAVRGALEGAGHIPHVTHPTEYVRRVTGLVAA
ncbi:hypothetical protein [Streptomyces sp. NPDC098781]